VITVHFFIAPLPIVDAARNGSDVDTTMGKGKLIDEILELNAKKLYSTDFHYRLSKGNVTIV
jgi:hypothetical protein